jgi:competence protein ComEC
MVVQASHRPPRPRPLALAALVLVAGLVLGLSGSRQLLAPLALIAVGCGLLAMIRDVRGMLVASVFLCIAAAGIIIGITANLIAERDCRDIWTSGERVAVVGVSLGFLPEGEQGSVRLQPEGRPGEQECVWTGPLRAWGEGPLHPGVLYEVEGSWRPAGTPGRGPRPPDQRGWIVAQRTSAVEALRPTRHPFLAVRGALARRLWDAYPRRWAPMAQALVLGQRETLSREVSQKIARAGLAHLLAISGLHVGMLAAALFALARTARLPTRSAQIAAVMATISYVLLIGAPASAVRAALMVLLWALTRLAGRASSAFDVLGLAAIALLVVRPWSVVEPGFQLSFAGAAAVGYAHSSARRFPRIRSLPPLLRGIALSLLTSVAAVLLTAPITASHFGRVAPAAILGNLAAIPLLGLAMPALFLSAILSPWPAMAAWPVSAAVVLLRSIDALAGALSGFGWASFDIASPGLLPVFAYAFILVLLAQAFFGAWERRRLFLVLGPVVAFFIIGPSIRARVTSEQVVVYVLDVGQGDAIAIATPGRHWLLVDAGPKIRDYDAGASRVLPFLREQGARELEAWLASHPDLDHVGGAPAVLEGVGAKRVIGSGKVTGQSGQIAVLRWLKEQSAAWHKATEGSRIAVDGVELAFLHPDSVLLQSDAAGPNDFSLVFLLTYGEFTMLFTGDVSGEVEDRLSLEYGEALQAEVLKIAHHGSNSSTTSLFLAAVQPELAVISVGRGNRYGHPSPRVLRRLEARGIPVRRTDRDGTLVIEAKRDGSWRVRSAADGY